MGCLEVITLTVDGGVRRSQPLPKRAIRRESKTPPEFIRSRRVQELLVLRLAAFLFFFFWFRLRFPTNSFNNVRQDVSRGFLTDNSPFAVLLIFRRAFSAAGAKVPDVLSKRLKPSVIVRQDVRAGCLKLRIFQHLSDLPSSVTLTTFFFPANRSLHD